MSDKAATLEYLESVGFLEPRGDPEGREARATRAKANLSERLGKLKVTYRGNTSISQGLRHGTNTFKIVESTASNITIESELPYGDGETFVSRSRIDFTADGYWVVPHTTKSSAYKEKFVRIGNPKH